MDVQQLKLLAGRIRGLLEHANVTVTHNQALDLSGPDQIACYDDGLGTSSFKPFALLGGAFGWGSSATLNISTLF